MAFGDAVPPVFGYLAPLLVLAFILAIMLPARPLRTTAHLDEPVPSSGAADQNPDQKGKP